MKKTKELIAAENAAKSKTEELDKAREAVSLLEREYAEAVATVRKLRETADAELPQCRVVRVSRFSGKEEDLWKMVIERKMPSGILVTRHVGGVSGNDYRFKFSRHSGVFVQAKKQNDYRMIYSLELRDVPPEYLSAGHAT